MKLKTQIFIFFTSVLAVTSTNAQTLFAGWDFSQFSGSGFNSTDGSTFTGEGNVQANYSDFLSPSPDVNASSFGSIYYNGSNGSFDGANGFSSVVSPFSGNLNSASNQTSDGNPFNDPGSYSFLSNSGQPFTNNLSLAIDGDFAIVVEANVFGQGTGANGWQLTFAALDTTDASSIDWEVSTDGVNYNELGITSNLTGTDSAFTVNAGNIYNGEDQLFFRGNFSNVDSRALIDNVGVSGSIVPEPSTYAVIFGLCALTFAIYRRKK